MTEAAESFPIIREAVASFPDRDHFHRAVSNLLAAGICAERFVGAGLARFARRRGRAGRR